MGRNRKNGSALCNYYNSILDFNEEAKHEWYQNVLIYALVSILRVASQLSLVPFASAPR